jgi:hypothetical protein
VWEQKGAPDDATPAEACCFNAYLCAPLPHTLRQLYNVLKRRPVPFHTETSRVQSPTEGAPDGQD